MKYNDHFELANSIKRDIENGLNIVILGDGINFEIFTKSLIQYLLRVVTYQAKVLYYEDNIRFMTDHKGSIRIFSIRDESHVSSFKELYSVPTDMYALYGISPEKQEVDKFYMIEDFVYALKEIYDRDIKPIVNLHEEAQISFKR